VPPKEEDFIERKVGILLLEDNADDAFFIVSELKKGGIAHVAKCVSQRDEFISALAEFKPDLVLSDYKLPEFAEMEPLRLVRERSPDLPFILVTGALGEELSVEVMKEGATDYILKDRLFRLVPAVKRALREAEERRRRREADELLKKQHEQLQRQNVALQESEERFRELAENIREVFWMTDIRKNETIYVSPGYEAIWGRSCQRLYELARDWVDAIHRDDRERVLKAALEKHRAWLAANARILKEVTLQGDNVLLFTPVLAEIALAQMPDREVFGPILHVVRYRADQLDRELQSIERTGYGLTLGIHSRIDDTVEAVIDRLSVGNVYVNRNMIGAVVGVQPFGGEGLSGTGPKAGGPRYLHRFAVERTLTIDTTAAGGNASLLSLQEEMPA